MNQRRQKVTVCTATFTMMWQAGTPTRIIAETLKISADRCDTARRELGLPPRESWHGSKTGHRTAYIPSEDEIKEKCRMFQAGWTEEERARRRVGWNPNPQPVEARIIPESLFFPSNSPSDDGLTTFFEDLADSSG
jgi:hypothetical protein